MKKIISYPGRFQPFHNGHYEVYKSLCNRFGCRSVRVVFSDKIEYPDSPFSYASRQMASTVYASVSARNLYSPESVGIEGSKDHAYIVVVSIDKNPERYERLIQGNYFKPYPGDDVELEPACDHGYVLVVPAEKNNEGVVYSASDIREDLINGDLETAWNTFTKSVPCGKSVKHFNMFQREIAEHTGDYSVKDTNKNTGNSVGHIMHPYEDMSLSLRDITHMIGKVATWEWEFEEKVDGQNMLVTFHNGELHAAFNKTQRNNPLDIHSVIRRFEDYEDASVLRSYTGAFVALKNMLASTDIDDLENPGWWLNVEIVNPNNPNVIEYDEKAVVLHNLVKFDQNGDEINSRPVILSPDFDGIQMGGYAFYGPLTYDKPSYKLEYYFEMWEDDRRRDTPDTQFVSKTDFTNATYRLLSQMKINPSSRLFNALNNITKQFNESNYDEPLHVRQKKLVQDEILKKAALFQQPIKHEHIVGLTTRFAYGQKYLYPVTDMKKEIPKGGFLNLMLNDFKPDLCEHIHIAREMCEYVTVRLTDFYDSHLLDNPKQQRKEIQERIDDVYDRLSDAGMHSDFKSKIIKMRKHSVPIEGFIFLDEDEKKYKLTGFFRDINQMVGTFKYNRI